LSRQYARQYASQLLFEVRPSKIYRNIIFLLFSAASLALLLLNTGFLIINLFAVLVLVYFAVYELKNNRLRQFHYREDGSWLIYSGVLKNEISENEAVRAELMQGSVVTAHIALLNFKLDTPAAFKEASAISIVSFYLFISAWIKSENRGYLSVLLFNDNIEEEKFRQLRVRLKVEGITRPAQGVL